MTPPTRTSYVCPLCGGDQLLPFASDKRRDYFQCGNCQLVSVPPQFYLSAEAEKAEYDLHENDLNDSGYRRFLSRISEPLVSRLQPGMQGLDFGCGPGPLLAKMFAEAGFPCERYDHFYFPDESVLQQRYDFISATEVVEHLSRPGEVLQRLWRLLNDGGYLALMTKRVIDQRAFAAWHYKNDPTHIVFFADASFEWLAQQWQCSLEFISADVVLFTKP